MLNQLGTTAVELVCKQMTPDKVESLRARVAVSAAENQKSPSRSVGNGSIRSIGTSGSIRSATVSPSHAQQPPQQAQSQAAPRPFYAQAPEMFFHEPIEPQPRAISTQLKRNGSLNSSQNSNSSSSDVLWTISYDGPFQPEVPRIPSTKKVAIDRFTHKSLLTESIFQEEDRAEARLPDVVPDFRPLHVPGPVTRQPVDAAIPAAKPKASIKSPVRTPTKHPGSITGTPVKVC